MNVISDSFLITQQLDVEISPGDSEIYLVCTGYWEDGRKDSEQRRTFTASGILEWTFREKGAERRSWRCSAFNEVGCLWRWEEVNGRVECLEFPVYGEYYGDNVPMANNTWLINSLGKRRTGEWEQPVNDFFAEWDPFQ